jgi:hypothetical protein
MAAMFSIAFTKSGSFRPVIVIDWCIYLAVLLCLILFLLAFELIICIEIIPWNVQNRRKTLVADNSLQVENNFFKYIIVVCWYGDAPASWPVVFRDCDFIR